MEKDEKDERDELECIICYVEIELKDLFKICNCVAIFHKKCYTEIIDKTSCIMCRTKTKEVLDIDWYKKKCCYDDWNNYFPNRDTSESNNIQQSGRSERPTVIDYNAIGFPPRTVLGDRHTHQMLSDSNQDEIQEIQNAMRRLNTGRGSVDENNQTDNDSRYRRANGWQAFSSRISSIGLEEDSIVFPLDEYDDYESFRTLSQSTRQLDEQNLVLRERAYEPYLHFTSAVSGRQSLIRNRTQYDNVSYMNDLRISFSTREGGPRIVIDTDDTILHQQENISAMRYPIPSFNEIMPPISTIGWPFADSVIEEEPDTPYTSSTYYIDDWRHMPLVYWDSGIPVFSNFISFNEPISFVTEESEN